MQAIKLRLSDKLDLNLAFEGPADTSVVYAVPANSQSKIEINASGVITPIDLGIGVVQVNDADSGNLIRNLLIQVQTDEQYAFDLANATALAGMVPPAKVILSSANAGNAVAIDDVVQSATNVTVSFVSEKVYSQPYRLTLLDPDGNPVTLSNGLTYVDVTEGGSLHTVTLTPQNPYILESGSYTATVSDLDNLAGVAGQPVAYAQVPASQSASGANALVSAVTDEATGDVTLTFAAMTDPLVPDPTHIKVTLHVTGETRLVPIAAFPFTYVWENLGQGNYQFSTALYDANSTTTGTTLDSVTVGLPSSPYVANRIKNVQGANVAVNTVEISWTSTQSTGNYEVVLIKQGSGTEYVLDAGTVRAGTSHTVQYTFTEQGTYDVRVRDLSASADTASYTVTSGGLFANDDADPTAPIIAAPSIGWASDQLTITFSAPVENETTVAQDKISVLVDGLEVVMWDSNLVSPIVYSLPSIYAGSQEIEVVRYVENSLGLNDTKSAQLTVPMKVDGSAPNVSATSLAWIDSGNGVDGDAVFVFSASDEESGIDTLSASIVVDGGSPTVVDLTGVASPYVWPFDKTYLSQSIDITLTATNNQGGQATSVLNSTVTYRPDATPPSVATPVPSWASENLTVSFTAPSDPESGIASATLKVLVDDVEIYSQNAVGLGSPVIMSVPRIATAQSVSVELKATNGQGAETTATASTTVPALDSTPPVFASVPTLTYVTNVNNYDITVSYVHATDGQSAITAQALDLKVDGTVVETFNSFGQTSPKVFSVPITGSAQVITVEQSATNADNLTTVETSLVLNLPADQTAPSAGAPTLSWSSNTLTATFTKAADAQSGITAESLEVYIGGVLSQSRDILALNSPQTFTVTQTGAAQTVMVRHKATNGAGTQTSTDSANLTVPANVDTSPPVVAAPSVSQVGISNGSGGVLRVSYTAASDPQSGIQYGGTPNKIGLALWKNGSFYTGTVLVDNVNGTYDFANYGAGTYQVQLTATNGDGYSTTQWSNTTTIAAPDTTPPQMAGGAASMTMFVDVNGNLRGKTGEISDNQSGLWWGGSSPYVGVSLYYNGSLVWGPDQQYFGNLHNGDGVNFTSSRPAGTYYFKVEAYDGVGNYNSWTSANYNKT